MPSKTSKKSQTKAAGHSLPPWKLERLCSELELNESASELWQAICDLQTSALTGIKTRSLFVSLEGEMGAGKSTFARALMRSENPSLVFKGSPTFALAHEYESDGVVWIHTDLYRLKSEVELQEAGIESYFWERQGRVIVIAEWLGIFPSLESSLLEECSNGERIGFRVRLDFVKGVPDQRSVCIERLDAT